MSSDSLVSFAPMELEVSVSDGTTVLDAGESVGADIEALCGGNGVCGTCMVRVEEGAEHLSPITDEERDVLDEKQLEKGYRLSCRTRVHGDLAVHVPPASRSQGAIVMTEGRELEFGLDPAVQLYQLSFPAPTLEDHTADRERLLGALAENYDIDVDEADYLTLTDLPKALRQEDPNGRFRCTGIVDGERELLDVIPGRSDVAYGLAVDIGTTTLAVYLLDLRTGEVEAVSSALNPQRTHGGDIISRVQYTIENADGSEKLQSEIVDGINDSIESVTREAGIAAADIYDAVFAGNTAMHHLFLGFDSEPVAKSPYVPTCQSTMNVKAREVGLDINESASLTWLPLIGGWVGADFVADLLAADILEREEPTLVIDIGTNGEMAVSTGERIVAASAPAGPALEGAEISRGVRAKSGAIESVRLDPERWEPEIDVIDDQRPLGICGSGILDTVAELFRVGAINRRGRLRDPTDDPGRIRDTEDGGREFLLIPAGETADAEDIVVTQEDIRDIQNAKAAIQSGSRVLLNEAGVDNVDRLVMAGGFGNYIDPKSAKLLGMYPEVGQDEVEFLGNAAGYGAMYALMNTDARRIAERIVDTVEYVELAAWEGFHDEFMQAMYLPHRDLDLYPEVRTSIESVQDINPL